MVAVKLADIMSGSMMFEKILSIRDNKPCRKPMLQKFKIYLIGLHSPTVQPPSPPFIKRAMRFFWNGCNGGMGNFY